MGNKIKWTLDPFFLKLGKGLRSSKSKFCLGEEVDIALDSTVIGKGDVVGPEEAKPTAIARFKDTTGKEIVDSLVTINEQGSISRPMQYRALALQTARLDNVTGDGTEYVFGTKSALTVIDDIGGAFYPGDGQGQEAYYTTPQDGVYDISFVVCQEQQASSFACPILSKIKFSDKEIVLNNISPTYYATTIKRNFSSYNKVILDLQKNMRLTFSYTVSAGTLNASILPSTTTSYLTYISIYYSG